jgi:hypothetical protein
MNMNATPDPATDSSGLRLVLPGRGVPLGSGWTWITGGWKLFARAPLMWIISLVLVFICMVAMALVPFLGQIAATVLQPVVLAGWIVASHSLERGGDFELDHLLGGFKKGFGNLCLVGLFFLVGEILILLVFVAFIFFSIGTAFLMAPQEQIIATLVAAGLTFTLGVLIALGLLLPLIAAYWFAPALVVMHDMQPLEAMKASFFACFRNFFPFLVYSIVLIPLGIVAMIPIGLGLLVLVPVMLAGTYVAYREIFTEEVANVPAKPTFA